MLLWKVIPTCLFCCLIYTAIAAEKTETKEVAKIPQEISNNSTYKTIAVLTALTTVAAGIVALAAWIVPLIAYKFCYFFGSCEYGLDVYVDQFLTGGRQNLRQTRSVDYVGPLLQTLAKAYEMYEDDNPKKNFKRETSYRR